MTASNLPDGLPDWIAQQFGCAREQIALDMVAGDASPRRYYRATFSADTFNGERLGGLPAGASCIAMVSPASENNEAFLYVGAKLTEFGIRTPKVWAENSVEGWFLLEDFGDQLLLPLLSTSASRFYELSFDALARLTTIPCDSANIPHYDSQRLRSELAIFPEWFLSGLLGLDVDAEAQQRIDDLAAYLTAVFAEQPTVWVHRDFHSRNLMLLDDSVLGVIDFQDAVLGPVTYDPVSLLKDCYIRWPRDQQLKWLDSYLNKLRRPGGEVLSPNVPMQSAEQLHHSQHVVSQLQGESAAQFERWFDLTGLQRHLRVLGVFARLHLRDHKSTYLADLPLVVAYVREALVLTSATDTSVAHFQQWFESDVMPVVIEQNWYKPVDPEGWAV